MTAGTGSCGWPARAAAATAPSSRPHVTRILDDYLDGRTSGPLFITRTGDRMGQPEAWKMIRRLAALDTAGQISPHSLRVATGWKRPRRGSRAQLATAPTVGSPASCAIWVFTAKPTKRARASRYPSS